MKARRLAGARAVQPDEEAAVRMVPPKAAMAWELAQRLWAQVRLAAWRRAAARPERLQPDEAVLPARRSALPASAELAREVLPKALRHPVPRLATASRSNRRIYCLREVPSCTSNTPPRQECGARRVLRLRVQRDARVKAQGSRGAVGSVALHSPVSAPAERPVSRPGAQACRIGYRWRRACSDSAFRNSSTGYTALSLHRSMCP